MNELNDMKEIEKLYAKPKSYSIPKIKIEGEEQIKIVVLPLGLDNMDLMDMKEGTPIDDIKKNVVKIISISLGISEESAKKITFKYLTAVMDAFKDANNLKEKDLEKSGINDYLAQKRKQIEDLKNKEVKPEAVSKDESDSKHTE